MQYKTNILGMKNHQKSAIRVTYFHKNNRLGWVEFYNIYFLDKNWTFDIEWVKTWIFVLSNNNDAIFFIKCSITRQKEES